MNSKTNTENGQSASLALASGSASVAGYFLLRDDADFWNWVDARFRNAPEKPHKYPVFATRELDEQCIEWPLYIDKEQVSAMYQKLFAL